MYTANNYETYITADNRTFPSAANAYPFSMLSVTMSTAQRLPISYDTSNAYVNKISLLPPTDLTMATGNLDAWFDTTYEIYSGPTAMSINTDNIKILMNNTSYSTNVAYTRGKLTANINDNVLGVGTISTTFPTYSTNATIEFNTYSNTMTLGTNTYIIPNTMDAYYDKFLRSNTLLYNSLIDLGELVSTTSANVNLGFGGTYGNFQYNDHVYVLGGGFPTPSTKCYKISTDLSLITDPVVTALTDFTFDFTGGGACLDTDNFYVYLFAPNHGNSLYRIKYNSTSEIFEGSWSLQSTSFPWSSVFYAGLSYYDNRLYALTGTITTGVADYPYINYYDIPTGVWGVITGSYGLTRRTSPQLAVGSKIYFGGSSSGGYPPDIDSWAQFDTVTSNVTLVSNTTPIPDTYIPTMTQVGTTLCIVDPIRLNANILKIDTTTDIISVQPLVASAQASQLNALYAPVLATDSTTTDIILYGGYLSPGGGGTNNVYAIDGGWNVTGDRTMVEAESIDYYNASFVGPTAPGNVPVVKSGIRLAQERVPIFTIEDSSTTANYLEFGFQRSNVVTAVQRSSRENKGIFENWYIDTKDTENLIINTGWEGTDSSNNYSQRMYPAISGLSISSSDVTSTTSVTITTALGIRPLVLNETITVTGHALGTPQDLALNQTYTVAGVTGPTEAVLTGTGMTPALTIDFLSVNALSLTAGTVSHTPGSRPVEVGEEFVVTGWTNPVLNGTYTVDTVTTGLFAFTNTTSMTGTPSETATFSQVINDGIYTAGTVIVSALEFSIGPVWAGDALNTNQAIANFYASNIIFQSTVNAAYSNIVFETGNISSGVDPRDNMVPNAIADSNVEYSTMPYMANNFFNYTVDGTVPYTSSNNSSITIANKFNPFVKSTFENYPIMTACYDTDNIPTTDWQVNYLATPNAIEPPYALPVSNVMVNDVYRQYLPSKITRAGRLDKVAFKYGASRWALPNNPTQQDATQQYGVFRDRIYPDPSNKGTQYLEMGARKLTLCSFSSDTLQTSNSQIEIYKYFASNVSQSLPPPNELNITERGWLDEIVIAFGAQTTASGEKEYVKISPGYDTASVTIGNNPSLGGATAVDDPIVVTFGDYNLQDLSVNVGLTYSSSVITRTVTPANGRPSNIVTGEGGGVNVADLGTTIKLSAPTFNALYDSQAKSGNVIITSTHNSGIVTSNTSFGERPTANVLAQNDVLFSQNLWSTCLSEWSQLPGTTADPSRIYAQENVYEEVFPVNISIQKYSPDGIYTNKLGRAIIKHVKFSIGGTTIQDLDDLWYITNDELLRSQDEKDSLKYLINGGEDYLPTSPSNYGPIDLYIPLDLFFCRTRKTSSTLITPVKVFDEYRSWKPYLPLCAMGSQDFEIEIEFYPQQYFSNTSGIINLPGVKTSIITEEILISPAERNYLKSQPQEFLIETATKFPEQIFSMTQPNVDQRLEGFIADYPVKMANWLFRSTQFENENDSTYFLHRYNFSTVVSTNDEYRLFFEFMKKAEFFIEGVPQIERFGISDYYKYVNALAGGLSSTQKNIYSYLFSMDPAKYGPSGSLNFSETNSNKTFLSFKIDPQTQSSAIEKVDTSLGATFHGWAYGFNVLKIEEGRAFKPFS